MDDPTVTELVHAMVKGHGVKEIRGKVMLRLLSGKALTEIARVLQWGAEEKYSYDNWRKISDPDLRVEYVSAALRHLLKHVDGRVDGDPYPKDSESNLSHLAHAGACLMILLHWMAEEDT